MVVRENKKPNISASAGSCRLILSGLSMNITAAQGAAQTLRHCPQRRSHKPISCFNCSCVSCHRVCLAAPIPDRFLLRTTNFMCRSRENHENDGNSKKKKKKKGIMHSVTSSYPAAATFLCLLCRLSSSLQREFEGREEGDEGQ